MNLNACLNRRANICSGSCRKRSEQNGLTKHLEAILLAIRVPQAGWLELKAVFGVS